MYVLCSQASRIILDLKKDSNGENNTVVSYSFSARTTNSHLIVLRLTIMFLFPDIHH